MTKESPHLALRVCVTLNMNRVMPEVAAPTAIDVTIFTMDGTAYGQFCLILPVLVQSTEALLGTILNTIMITF